MSRTIQQKLHAQHRAWQSDHEAWLIDINEWKKELRTALADLREVEDMLRDSLDGLEVHADALWEEWQRLRAHELALGKEVMAGERKKTDKQWAAIHHRQLARHERTVDAHTRIKKYQHAVVAEIVRLVKQARRGM